MRLRQDPLLRGLLRTRTGRGGGLWLPNKVAQQGFDLRQPYPPIALAPARPRAQLADRRPNQPQLHYRSGACQPRGLLSWLARVEPSLPARQAPVPPARAHRCRGARVDLLKR